MNHGKHGDSTTRSTRRLQLTYAALVTAALIATASIGVAGATAASWELVKTFAPLSIPKPPPKNLSEFPEDAQLGGVSGMAVNETGAGGVDPGTLYPTGALGAPPWNVARYSAEGSFELAWTAVSRCGPKVAPP